MLAMLRQVGITSDGFVSFCCFFFVSVVTFTINIMLRPRSEKKVPPHRGATNTVRMKSSSVQLRARHVRIFQNNTLIFKIRLKKGIKIND